ncbi:ras-related protein Rab-40B-like [Pundamilia nyererei]|uniref:small monomeric GTPase n=1 Tax=Pundamilia nyererei TaxID=303518 RepID=A0A9Y3S0W8_9CICH|nr:PREDICTED: ras-related protein Rab-40B-like [Pundamilia nyererei]
MSHRSSPARAYDFLLKFLLVGDSDVGKGEILASLQDGATESPYGYNMGIDYKTTTILLDGRRVKLQLWYEHAVVHTAAYVSCYQSVWKESRGQPKYTGGM